MGDVSEVYGCRRVHEDVGVDDRGDLANDVGGVLANSAVRISSNLIKIALIVSRITSGFIKTALARSLRV